MTVRCRQAILYELPFIGVIDLVAGVRGKRAVINFKTSQTKYAPHEVVLADQ